MRKLLLSGGFLVLGLGAFFLSSVWAVVPLFSRSFELTYNVNLKDLPADAGEVKIWVPLASSNSHQKIRVRTIRVPVPYQVTHEREYGNEILFLNLRRPLPGALDISIQYEVEVHGQKFDLNRAEKPLSADAMRMLLDLKSNQLLVVNDEIKELAESITAGAKNPREKVERIYRYVIERMSYDKQIPGYGRGDTMRACEVGAGNCTDFHSLFISLARASGIPARFQIGLPVPEKAQGEIPGYHCWAFVYLPAVGWVPVDASEAWKNRQKHNYFLGTYDPNRLAVSTGRDITLVPKAVGGPVNIFFFPYVEVDGKLLEKEKIVTKFQFRDLAQEKK